MVSTVSQMNHLKLGHPRADSHPNWYKLNGVYTGLEKIVFLVLNLETVSSLISFTICLPVCIRADSHLQHLCRHSNGRASDNCVGPGGGDVVTSLPG